MALPKPAKFPEWARVPSTDPIVGGDNVVEPSEQKKDDGWMRNEKPPANIQNWLHKITNDWLEYLAEHVVPGVLFTTGDWKFSDKLTEDTNIWLKADNGTLGNDSSVATHKGDIYEDLFTFYWDNYNNTKCPVLPGGRGASAAADWAANKNLKILRKIDRFPVAASATAEYAPGDTFGANAVALTLPGENAPHPHDYDHIQTALTFEVASGTDVVIYETGLVSAATTSSGGGTPHENRPAYFASNIFIKL